MKIKEAAREIEVLDEVDVLVAGGGVAGCAAAVAAARAGGRTMLLERNGVLGGVATAGLMANIGNRFLDGDGRVVVDGIAREVVERMAARGAASESWASREVPGVVIDSEQLKALLVEMQLEAASRCSRTRLPRGPSWTVPLSREHSLRAKWAGRLFSGTLWSMPRARPISPTSPAARCGGRMARRAWSSRWAG